MYRSVSPTSVFSVCRKVNCMPEMKKRFNQHIKPAELHKVFHNTIHIAFLLKDLPKFHILGSEKCIN